MTAPPTACIVAAAPVELAEADAPVPDPEAEAPEPEALAPPVVAAALLDAAAVEVVAPERTMVVELLAETTRVRVEFAVPGTKTV